MAHDDDVIPVNDANFDEEVLRAREPVLVDFGAKWCGPCKALTPIVTALARENTGRVKVVMVDLDDSPGVATRYGIRAAPTVAIFHGGAKTAQHVGLTTKTKLLELLARGTIGRGTSGVEAPAARG